ncbi:MAG: DUF3326 domain-containing protein [Elainella sp. Prado103]|nr:DUF3326 domain-containing protein [Elainella sp. Prado103]
MSLDPVRRPYTAILIVPTGVGAAIGGYAGDALPVARGLSQVVDRLITHPNVLNGAQLYWPLSNALYTEGYGLDQFAAGEWGLRPVRQNRIGLVLDQAIEPDLRLRHLQVADAAKATLGLSLTDYVMTDQPLGVTLKTADSGTTWGTIQHPDSLLRAVEKLKHDAKAEAIAVVARFPDDVGSLALQEYRHGQGVDCLAGAEAIISHLVVRTFRLPCAHAPALSPLPIDPDLSPRSAAEELGYTFLPCVLVGLSQAPQLIDRHSRLQSTDIWAEQVDVLVVPETACGGSAVLSLSQTPTQIITVRENTTQLHVTADQLGIARLSVHSYLEAIGAIAALRSGLNPQSLTAQIDPIRLYDQSSGESIGSNRLH